MSYLVPVPKHDDMLGEVRSAVGGGTQWTTAQIRDTGFILGWLANNSNDFVQCKIQVPHRRKLGSNLDSFHLHYMYDATAPTSGQTIVWTGKYVWLKIGDAVPANASWTDLGTVTWTLSADAAYTYRLNNFVANISPPASEGYAGMILLKMTRGNGTYTGSIGVLDIDAHSIMDRLGSTNEASE